MFHDFFFSLGAEICCMSLSFASAVHFSLTINGCVFAVRSQCIRP